MISRIDYGFWTLLVGCSVFLVACEAPQMEVAQGGYRGLGVEQVTNPRLFAQKMDANQVPTAAPQAPGGKPKASKVYENVQLLGDLSVPQFARLMSAMNAWVAPNQDCTFCHSGEDLAAEAPYTKIVSRRMLEMTRDINDNWKQHVGETGVTCYTCHRGLNVPEYVWSTAPDPANMVTFVGGKAGQNTPAMNVGVTSLPYDPFSMYLLGDRDVRVQPGTALPTGHELSVKNAEETYALMVHLSGALGVNCGYCHNTRSFMPWEASYPPRVTAWHGIRMVRSLNQEYLEPLTDTVPANRKGPGGDILKINCSTCHQGLPKPLAGVSMVGDYPSLRSAPESAATGEGPEGTAEAEGVQPESVQPETAELEGGETERAKPS